jgi:uncharacterized delta-60 repeat protein
LLAGGAASVRGQSALDGFDPNANGIIRAVVVQPDGKILIGGDFTSLAPNGGATVTRNFLARLNSDGTLDTNFNPNASGEVAAIAVQADGKILAGGSFTSIGGQTRTFLARLDATNGTADSFNPSPNSDVTAIAVQADGKILVGGDFNEGNGTPTIGGATRNNVARLDPTTGLADSFDPNADSTVDDILVQANGEILLGGSFNSLTPNGGAAITRHHIARVFSTGLADSFAPDANGIVYSLAIQADGKIVVGGNFSGTGSIGGQTRNHIARLDAVTGLADSFNPNANQQVLAVAVQQDGKILAGGNFAGTNSIGGQPRGRIARLDPITGLADSFDPEANFPVLVIAVQQDGKILAVGQLTSLSADGETALTRNHIVRLETDGRPDQTLSVSTGTGVVYATAVQPDGKILIGGNFGSVLGVTRNRIARLNTDGTLDTNFNPNASYDVYSIAVQPDGKILAGGGFTSIGGQTRHGIARLDATNGLADAFDPEANSYVYALAVQADGEVLAAGEFTSIGGQTRNHIARLDPTTGLADAFDPEANNDVFTLAVQPDGKILAGGYFTSIGGQTRNYIARLTTNGLADAFDPEPNSYVYALAVQADGEVLEGGDFTNIANQARNYIARLTTNGVADAFDPDADGEGYTFAVQADGKVIVGGDFFDIGDQFRAGFARLDATTGAADDFNPDIFTEVASVAIQADGKILAGITRLSNDTAAQRTLTVMPTAITWILDGASPQFERVTFESSTDNVNYTLLGNGTATGSNWNLTGLNLPTGQNIYIRARGYYSSGYENGSESIVESVRNAFLTPLVMPVLNIQLSANTNVVLSWSTNYTGFTLESNASFNTNGWGTVTPAPVVSGTNNVVTNAISGSTHFYRLSQ